jgi:hypothetical protein
VTTVVIKYCGENWKRDSDTIEVSEKAKEYRGGKLETNLEWLKGMRLNRTLERSSMARAASQNIDERIVKLTLEHRHVVVKTSGLCSPSEVGRVALHMMRLPAEEDTAPGEDTEGKLAGTEERH